jgi:hypothetical protein
MHIESALRGVSETDRCAGWRTGQSCGSRAAVVESAYVATEEEEEK